jgi:hypothetical protein
MIGKALIWAEIETLAIVFALARRNGISETHQFMQDLQRYKQKIEQDLIEETEKKP